MDDRQAKHDGHLALALGSDLDARLDHVIATNLDELAQPEACMSDRLAPNAWSHRVQEGN